MRRYHLRLNTLYMTGLKLCPHRIYSVAKLSVYCESFSWKGVEVNKLQQYGGLIGWRETGEVLLVFNSCQLMYHSAAMARYGEWKQQENTQCTVTVRSLLVKQGDTNKHTQFLTGTMRWDFLCFPFCSSSHPLFLLV